MTKQLINMVCFYLFITISGFSQTTKLKKADDTFEDYAYANAIEAYEQLVDSGYTDEQIFKNLGDANYKIAKYDAAADWYSKLFKLTDVQVDADYMFRYAQSLKSTKEYAASDAWMKKFEAAKMNDKRAKKFVENQDYLKKIEARSGKYDIETLSINSPQSDFAPSFNGEQLVFSTARDSGFTSRRIHQWNNGAFLNLYISNPSESGEYLTSTRLDAILNKKTHESSTAFTKDGNTVYFTRNNSENGNFVRDDNGVSRLKIYRARLSDGVWKDIVPLPFNGDDYSAAHPALSADEKKLYFSSDMAGSLGQSDIFVVDLYEDGSVGTPKNLGNTINTEGRETFPYVTKSNTLYFASDGHPGLGGLDIFATKIDDPDDYYIVNIGKPVNSEQDDFSFIINEDSLKGFFASNRNGGIGDDDIYGFIQKEPIDLRCTTSVTGIVEDRETGEPLSGATLMVSNEQGKTVTQGATNDNGTFVVEGSCKAGAYQVTVVKNEYNEATQLFTIVQAEDTEGLKIGLEKTIKKAPTGSELTTFLNLEPVYFDLNKADIRLDASKTMVAVIEYLKKFPDLKVQVRSYTDAKAGNAYNMKLSQKRADNTLAYLRSNGVSMDRITGKGFGETQLINECDTRESCTDEKHQKNRRSVFVVVE